MKAKTKTSFNKVLVLLSVLVQIVAGVLFILRNKTEVNQSDENYFNAGIFYKPLWLIVWIAFFVYGLIRLLPPRRGHSIYDKLFAPVILINLLMAGWMVTEYYDQQGWNFVFLIVCLGLAFYCFLKANREVLQEGGNLWLQFPFCVLASWLSFLLVSGFFNVLQHVSLSQDLGEGVLAFLLIILLCGGAAFVSFGTYSLVFPAVITCAFCGSYFARPHVHEGLADPALGCGIVLMLTCLAASFGRRIKNSGKIKSPPQIRIEHH
jgi:hypothetical protein